MVTTNLTLAQNQATGGAVDQQVRLQIAAAKHEAQAAATDARAAAAGVPSAPAVAGSEGVTVQQIPWNPNDDIPPRAMGLGITFLIVAAFVAVFMPLARALARKVDRPAAAPRVPPEMTNQLAQLTQAVDAIAVEVERISEGQRFTTKLLAEQRGDAQKTLMAPAGGDASSRL